MFLISILSNIFLALVGLFVILSICLLVCLSYCQSVVCFNLSITFPPSSFVCCCPASSTSACCLACLSFFHALVCLLLSCLPLFLPAILPVWLSVTTLVYLPVRCLSASLSSAPIFLLLTLLSVLSVAVLPVCLSFMPLVCLLLYYLYFCLSYMSIIENFPLKLFQTFSKKFTSSERSRLL